MEKSGNKILATAFRELAVAEANSNGSGSYLEASVVLDWLDSLQADLEWLRHHIQHDLDLQRDIQDLIPENLRKTCTHCGRWFVPQRSTAKYDTGACRQAAHKNRKRNGGNAKP
jgi:hypothetical protein